MNGHIGDSAALYALGALDDAERAAIDAHVIGCEQCARLLGAAEEDVTQVVSAERAIDAPPQLEQRIHRTLGAPTATVAPRPWRLAPAFVAAVAAAFVIGILPSLFLARQNESMHGVMRTDVAALNRLTASPHRTATFRGLNGAASARVMYGPDGSWYVIVVTDTQRALDVAWMHDGAQTTLGTAVPHDRVAMLYLPKSHRMDRLALMDGTVVVAEASLTY